MITITESLSSVKFNLLDIPVYFINLERDTEKRDHMVSMLAELGFKNVNRIDAIQSTPGIVGLSKSQNLSLSQIPAPFIVLEDDCDIQNFVAEIEVPDDADAVYLGNSPWGRVDGHHGLLLRATKTESDPELYRIYNMLSSHAILYITDDYVGMCKRTTKYCSDISAVPMDVPFADIQKYFNVYAFEKPHFVQKEYENAMSNAPAWTNKNISDHKKNKTTHKRLFEDPFFATKNMIR